MEILIKLVVALSFLSSKIYRCRWTWQDFKELYKVKCQEIPRLKKVEDLYKLSNYPKIILVVWSILSYIILPINLTLILIGTVIFMLGLVIAISARYSLGRSWADFCEVTESPEPLVKLGLYSWCRNPIYLGLGIEWIGFVVTFGGQTINNPYYLILVVAIAISSIAAFHKVVLEEEKILYDRFGEEYARYCQETSRYLPIKSFIKKSVL